MSSHNHNRYSSSSTTAKPVQSYFSDILLKVWTLLPTMVLYEYPPRNSTIESNQAKKINSDDESESELFPLHQANARQGNEQEYGTITKETWKERDWKSSMGEEDQKLSHQYFLSTMIIYFCVLMAEMARGIMFPTLWLNVKSLGGTKSFQGVVVSGFSMGRIVSAPILGYLSEIYGHQFALILSNSIIMIGAFIYANANSLHWLLTSQIIMGIGAGSLGVTRSYVAETTPTIRRTEYIAYLTALQYAGFTVTPIFGAILAAIFQFPNDNYATKFSAPAYFLASMSILSIILLFGYFENASPNQNCCVSTRRRQEINESSTEEEKDALMLDSPDSPWSKEGNEGNGNVSKIPFKGDLSTEEGPVEDIEDSSRNQPITTNSEQVEKWRGSIIFFGMLLNFITKGSIGVFETLMIIISIKYFEWNAVKTGIVISCFGVIGVLILSNFSILLRYFKDYQLVPIGMGFMIIACLLLNNNYFFFSFAYNDSILLASLLCMISIGYPIGHTTLIGLFSRLLLLQQKQGKSLGLFVSVGSLARIVFPIMAGLAMDYFHHFNVIFLMLGVLLFVTLLAYVRLESLIAELLIR